MDRFISGWSAIPFGRKIAAVAAAIAVFGGVLWLAQMASSPRMALLYAGLEPAEAGEVITAIEAQGIAHEVRGTAIYVDGAMRDSLRLTLAGQGLPANGAQGYELLDGLSGFGTTAQMFDAAYWRAKEGELARTIMTNRQISAARVHLSNPTNDPFSRGGVRSASVTVTTTGGMLSPGQALALRHMVASAVAELDPADVAIIDSRNGLVPQPDRANPFGASGDTKADTLRQNVMRLLEARVGVGNAIVEVNVDTVDQRETISERRLDPDSRIAISSDSEENTTRANDSRGGAVTVASNLPAGDSGTSGQSSDSSENRTREVINYEVSETQREVLREPGAVRRISVAVLVDGLRSVDDAGVAAWVERPSSELESLRDLVASAIGFDAERGDSITIKSLEFQPVEPPAAAPPLSIIDRFSFDAMALVQLAVLAIVVLVLALFVLRPLMLSAARPSTATLPPPGETTGSFGLPALPGVTGDLDLASLGTMDDPLDMSNSAEDAAARLRRLIEDRKDETVEVLAQWMRDTPERAS